MRTRIYKDLEGDVYVEQSVSVPDGRGRLKWMKDKVLIDPKTYKKISKFFSETV